MRLHDVFSDVAQLAAGRAVRVLDASGAVYEPPLPPAPPAATPHPLVEQLTRVEQGGVAARAALGEATSLLNGVTQAVQQLTTGQREVLAGLVEVERAVSAPTESVPVYDKAGKMIGARRVKQGTLK